MGNAQEVIASLTPSEIGARQTAYMNVLDNMVRENCGNAKEWLDRLAVRNDFWSAKGAGNFGAAGRALAVATAKGQEQARRFRDSIAFLDPQASIVF